jgi:predicted phage terminase large subunit-like protein
MPRRWAVSQARAHKPGKILIEDVGLRTALIQDLKKRGLSVVPVVPERDKLNRLMLQVPKFANRQVFLPKRWQWLPDLESELFLFPDVVDALVQALGYQHTAYGWTPKGLDNLDKVMWSWAFR